MPGKEKESPLILTIGHSTRAVEDFIALLRDNGVTELVDIRTVPRSRHNPQFNRESLPETLARGGIAYVHAAALGGLRKPHKDSPNAGWRNDGFRGFADYMGTPEFAEAVDKLIAEGKRHRLAIMCAEAVPWRCHRSLIADALITRGVPVEHIMDAGRQPHHLTSFAHVEGTRITYPGEADPQGKLL